VRPDEQKHTGFVSRIQANMDPQHHGRAGFSAISSLANNCMLAELSGNQNGNHHATATAPPSPVPAAASA
jgi:peptide subunit release factor RF-3